MSLLWVTDLRKFHDAHSEIDCFEMCTVRNNQTVISLFQLPWAIVHWLIQCTPECHWNTICWPGVNWDTTGWPSEYLQFTPEHPWKNVFEFPPHWNATGKTLTIPSYTRTLHTHANVIKVVPMPVLKWQDGGTPSIKYICLCKFSLYS